MFLKNCGANETFLDGLYFCWYRFQVVFYCFKYDILGFIPAGLLFLRVFFYAFCGGLAMGVHFVSVVISPSWHAPYNRICLSLGYIYWLSLDY